MAKISKSKLCGCAGECGCRFIAGDAHFSTTSDGTSTVITFAGVSYDNDQLCGIQLDGAGNDSDPLCGHVCQTTFGGF